MSDRRLPLAIFLALVCAFPWFAGDFHLTLANLIGLGALVTLGLVLLTGIAGLTSFGQAAFVGVGAYTTAYLSTAHQLSPWLGLLAGLALTLVIATVLAALTLRLAGHYLPLGTLAWGLSLYYLFGNLEALGKHTGLSGIPALTLFGFELRDPRHYYLLIWALALLALWGTLNLLDSRSGRAIRSLRGGALMAESMGVDTRRAKLVAFLLAALLASLAGWLYAHLQRFVSPTPFGLGAGIEYLFMAVIGGVAHPWGAFLGAGVFTLLKQALQDLLPRLIGAAGSFETIVFGVMMVLMLQHVRGGLWPYLRRRARPRPRRMPVAAALPSRGRPVRGTPLLEARAVTKRFGGLVANDAVDVDVRAGEIVALIGPNGAGKSTLFNCLSGVSGATAGRVTFRGQDITRSSARAIANAGMSRTFQHVRMLAGMSVLENVAIGAHPRGRLGVGAAVLRLDRAEEARLLGEAMHQLERVGLADRSQDPAGTLALGPQRIMEIARALCGDPDLLLLDEPAAGLRVLEKEALAVLLARLRDEGVSVLLVEHDMAFVMGLADRVVVMDFGQKICEGTPQQVQADPRVREAYLGVSR